ncbi:MAG: hypothetical protein AAF624_14315 [Bacteroidota bacterium]
MEQPKENGHLSLDAHREAAELTRIGNRAVAKAQARNRALGIPNAYSHHGRLYFELPSGEITDEDPFA